MGDSKQKFTPGPWHFDEVRTDVGRAFRIGSGEMLTAGKGCCIIYDDYPGNPDNERRANAVAISALPDLVEALQELRTDLTILRNIIAEAAKTDPRWEGMPATVQSLIDDRIDAALSKAGVKV